MLIAREQLFDAFGEHWGGGDLIPVSWVLTAGSILAVGIALLWLWNHWRHRKHRPNPWKVYRDAARMLNLTLSEQWLLARIARAQKLPSPLTLLLSRATLRYHAMAYARSRPGRRGVEIACRVASLRRRIFKPAASGSGAGESPQSMAA